MPVGDGSQRSCAGACITVSLIGALLNLNIGIGLGDIPFYSSVFFSFAFAS